MARQNNLSFQTLGARNCRIKILNFEPQQHAVADSEVRLAYAPVMMRHLPIVQLKNQPAIRDQPLVIWAAMGALAPEKLLIPAARRLDVPRANKRLWMHRPYSHPGSPSSKAPGARTLVRP